MPNYTKELGMGLPPRGGKKLVSRSHARAPEQEKQVAAKLGGRLTPGSGSKSIKGDVRVKGIARIECKTTSRKSFSVTVDMFQKLEQASMGSGEVPALVVEFNDGKGRALMSLAVVPMYVLEELCQR